MMNKRIKLKYVISRFDIERLKAKVIKTIEITEDGYLFIKDFENNSRKIAKKQIHFVGESAVTELYAELRNCIDGDDLDLILYCDDVGCELTIYHDFGRREIVPRGYGNSIVNIDSIMDDFVSKYDDSVVDIDIGFEKW